MNSLETLRSFRIFAETLNFTHAAEELHLSQPALHTKIRELARSLGQPLYLKQGRQLHLTEAGQKLLVFAREMEARVQDFQRQLRGESEQPLRLASGQGAYRYLLGPALKAYRGQLELRLGGAESVRSGLAHLGVGVAPADISELEVQPFREVGQVLLIPKQHPLARKRRLRLRDCRDLQLVVPPPGRPQRLRLEECLPPFQVAAEAEGWELTLYFVVLGLGVAVVNSFCPVPKGFVARELDELPAVSYQVFLPKAYARPQARQLARLILNS
ncbi:LysR family transcriptional regulator [bacterium]|nr:LysR family transcriptional regulator [bacterium]